MRGPLTFLMLAVLACCASRGSRHEHSTDAGLTTTGQRTSRPDAGTMAGHASAPDAEATAGRKGALAPGEEALARIDMAATLQRVVVEGTATCLRVRWTGAEGPCSQDYSLSAAEELFFVDRPQSLVPAVFASDPTREFPRLRPGDEVRKQLHADSECDRDFDVHGRVSSVEECFAVRFTGSDRTLVPVSAAQLTRQAKAPAAALRPLGTEDVVSMMRARKADVNGCVTAHPLQAALLPYGGHWRIEARWRVLPDGTVTDAEVTAPTALLNSEVANCIVARISRWSFPASAQGLPQTGYSFGPYLAK